MENHWRNTIFNVAVNDSDNQRSKRQPTILGGSNLFEAGQSTRCTVVGMRCPRGHGGCQIGYSLPSQRPYWECTQCTFSEWLVKMDHQASASRRGSRNKPGRMRSTGKFVSSQAVVQPSSGAAPSPMPMAGLGAPPSPMPVAIPPPLVASAPPAVSEPSTDLSPADKQRWDEYCLPPSRLRTERSVSHKDLIEADDTTAKRMHQVDTPAHSSATLRVGAGRRG